MEYKVITLEYKLSAKSKELKINEFAIDGWILDQFTEIDSFMSGYQCTFIFKRESINK